MFHCAEHSQARNQKGTLVNVLYWHRADINGSGKYKSTKD